MLHFCFQLFFPACFCLTVHPTGLYFDSTVSNHPPAFLFTPVGKKRVSFFLLKVSGRQLITTPLPVCHWLLLCEMSQLYVMIYIYIYIYKTIGHFIFFIICGSYFYWALDWDSSSSSSSSSCRAASTDIPYLLSPLLPIVHHLCQVLRATSCILT